MVYEHMNLDDRLISYKFKRSIFLLRQ